MRTLRIWDSGFEPPVETFRNDQAMMAVVGAGRHDAQCRLWQRSTASLCAGRFHRLPTDVSGIDRRTSGGRVVPAGPGVLACTLVVPQMQWLDPAADPLRPEQVLNRALRPLLAILRGLGVDAFYPGRDVVTVDRRTLACAAFAVAADGVVMVEQFLAVEDSFSVAEALVRCLDPVGVMGSDGSVMRSAIALAELTTPPTRQGWERLVGAASADAFRCDVIRGAAPQATPQLHAASEAAFSAFRAERTQAQPGLLR